MFPRRGSKLLLDRITRFGLGVLDLAVGKWFYDRTVATGTKEECLAYIDEVWTDLTPRSVRATEPVR